MAKQTNKNNYSNAQTNKNTRKPTKGPFKTSKEKGNATMQQSVAFYSMLQTQ